MEITEKMPLFGTRHGKSRSDWDKLMEDVLDNFKSMYSIGRKAIYKVYFIDIYRFHRLDHCSSLFMRCMLKWCVEEDGRINRYFVDILTDVETYLADAVRFILQYACFDGKDFSNIDHLLPRMAKACLHVLTADSSPPNFNISYDSLKTYAYDIQLGSYQCQGLVYGKCSTQLKKVRALSDFVYHTRDKINHINGQELLISLESVYDKVACNVLLGCWESYYNMCLSGPNINMDTLFDASIRKVSALHLDMCSVAIGTDEILKAYIETARQRLKQLQTDQDIDLTHTVKIQLKMLHRALGIIVYVLANCPPQLQVEEGSNLDDVRLEVRALVRGIESIQNASLKMLRRALGIIVYVLANCLPQLQVEEGSNLDDARLEVRALVRGIESLTFLFFTTQTECINPVVAAAVENIIPGIRHFIEDRVIGLTMTVHLTHELLFEFMERVLRFMSQTLEGENLIQTNPVKNQLEMLHHDLFFYVNFHVDYPLGYYTEPGEGMSVGNEVQTVASNLESFIYSVINQTDNIELVAAKIILGLQNMLVSVLKTCVQQLTSCAALPLTDELLIQFMECVQRFLSRMLKDEHIIPDGPARVQLEFLHHEMGNLVHFHINYLTVGVRMEVQTVVMNTASFVISTLISQAKQDATKIILGVRILLASILTAWVVQLSREYLEPTISTPMSYLVEKFTNLKVDVVQDIIFLIIVCRLRRITPLTDQLGFFNFLLDKMIESKFGGQDFEQLRTIYEALLLLRDFLKSMTNNSIAYSHDICERVANVAHEAEYFMHSLYDGTYSASCRALWVYQLLQHFEKKENDGETTTGFTGDQNHVSSQLIPAVDVVVGFEDEMRLVKQRLTASNKKQLDVVSIIGMPGLGKTTLARKVYEDRQIADHFQVRAWCCVSNEYNRKELLLTILGCIIELTDMIQKTKEAELSTLVHKQLKGRRYLVVMDDVWGIDSFEFLKVYLPNKDNNGSRILLTSRNKVIGLKAKQHSDILELRMLTDDESWVLLSKKVYGDQESPSELCQAGKKIAENCRGLPLAVVVVAGLLAKSNKTREFWEQVAENLSSYISHDSQEQGMAVLELSYKHLPRHLKPLFLFIGAFPKDREVPVENLIWLWIAEGFVRANMLGSLEHQAELYLTDLIDRSFLMVAARRSDGRVKSCIVHDLLRDMCLLKAKEEHLLQQITVSDYLPDPISYQYRLSVVIQRREYGTPTHLLSDGSPTRPFIAYEGLSTLSLAPPLYSFLFFNKNKSFPLWDEAVASVLRDLKLLRILHFESTSIDANLCGDVMKLVCLRYISIRAAWNSIPTSISKLRNLETLIIKGLRGEIEVSEEIWELVKLRHLHVNDRAKFSYPSGKSSMLENLETLSTPAIRRGDEEKLMRRVPNVRKVRCIFLESCPQLESPNQLESLKAIFTGVGRCPGSFAVPSTLKKLSLSKFRLKWEQVSMLHDLPELEILNLRIGAVDGDLWEMGEEEEFLKLKVLKLESLNIRRWNACDYNFPCLEKLVLKKCKQLIEIPSELGEINCLQKMEVLSCSNSAAISAKRIEEEQIKDGNESLEVHIYPPANLGSSS